MQVAERTLTDLGFEEIRRAVAARCRTDPGRQRALVRPFLPTASEVHDELALVEEARRLLREPLSVPVAGVGEIRENVQRAAKGAMLEPRELIEITHALFAFERTREVLDERRDSLPLMGAVARRIPDLERLATRLDRSFEAGGEISDRASTSLREARDRVRGLHRSIKAKIEKLLQDEKFAANLRERYFSIRNDRYVFPVLAQERAQIPGIVHNASQSGQTLFVEPEALIGHGNELAIAQSMVLEEERRILLELSAAVGREAEGIAHGVEACARLDEAEAAAKLAGELDAYSPRVELDAPVALKSLRHPLLVLQGKDVISNDVELVGEVRALVISGPNAGGKTVTLTAVGLCALMLRSGLPIPVADGSRLPLFPAVHSAIGDAQDLAQGLSTFSAHVTLLRDIDQATEPDALILIDEIAADTDPKEGAAIAVAVLEDLLERGAVVLVTTHLEELKALAHLDARFVNARVGFDARRMAPTYKLQLGAAGASSAIEMAARVGLPERICARARELVRGAGGPLAHALSAAEEERQRLGEELEKARARTAAAEAAQAQHERELAELKEMRQREELRFREALAAELQFAQTQVRDLVAQLKARDSAQFAAQAQRELFARLDEQQQKARDVKEALAGVEPPRGPPDLRRGGWVHHRAIDKDVEVLELEEDTALVRAGAMKMRVPIRELSAARGKRPSSPAAFPTKDRRRAQLERAELAAAQSVELPGAACDLRGLRADEALRTVEQFLDRAFRDGEETALIIHGHGTGALKQTVREYLDSSPYVRLFRPGESQEGGDGVTVVAFRS